MWGFVELSRKLVFSTSLWVWVWAKGKSTCLLCDFVNNTFWPRGSEGKKSSPQDRCLFQNLKMFIFQHHFDFHILLHCVFRIGMNVAQKWEEKATQWDGPIKIILLSPPKIPALPLPYETTKCFDIQIIICLIAISHQLIRIQAHDNLWFEWKCPVWRNLSRYHRIQKQIWMRVEKRHKRGNFQLNFSLFGHQSKGIKLWRGTPRYQHWAFQACRNPKRDGHLWASWRVTEMSNNHGWRGAAARGRMAPTMPQLSCHAAQKIPESRVTAATNVAPTPFISST